MPLQNRVAATGEIVAHPARGLLMGNRGCLHDADRALGAARWRSRLWICCRLDFKGVRRDPMPPGRWTALFFLDEATALAAGHRPCAYCRRAAYNDFAEAWRLAQGLERRPLAPVMDALLHGERVHGRTRAQRTHAVPPGGLPDGAMVLVGGAPSLVRRGELLPWSFEGYGPRTGRIDEAEAVMLTPPRIVAALRAGYRPLIHPSAG